MAVRAVSDPRYYRRFLIMGLVALGFALWSLYDGAVKYPQQRVRALKYLELEQKFSGSDPVLFRDQWHETARQNGWPTSYPGDPKGNGDIILQYVMAGLAGSVGLWLLWGVWRARGTWIESTDSGIASSWGQSLAFDQVELLDKRKWRNKGIAKIIYRENSRKRRFLLDDYKFDRQATGQVLRELEAKIAPEMIIGGPPEVVPEDSGPDSADGSDRGPHESALVD